MDYSLEDKVLIKKSIDDNIDFLVKNYNFTRESYNTCYENIERIYDYAIKTLPVKPECHDITMLYITHEVYDMLKAEAIRIQQKHPKKNFKIIVYELSDYDIMRQYKAMFELDDEAHPESG
jgi:hypothetical protein